MGLQTTFALHREYLKLIDKVFPELQYILVSAQSNYVIGWLPKRLRIAKEWSCHMNSKKKHFPFHSKLCRFEFWFEDIRHWICNITQSLNFKQRCMVKRVHQLWWRPKGKSIFGSFLAQFGFLIFSDKLGVWCGNSGVTVYTGYFYNADKLDFSIMCDWRRISIRSKMIVVFFSSFFRLGWWWW